MPAPPALPLSVRCPARYCRGVTTDLDTLITERRPAWDRLRELTTTARRTPSRLSAVELDELVDEYLRTSADLAAVNEDGSDPALHSELTQLVANAAGVVYGTEARSRSAVLDFLRVQWPAAVWELRLQIGIAVVALVLPALLVGGFVVRDARALPTLGSEQDLQQFVEQDFTDYYTDNPNPVFAALVGTNNIQVGLLAFGAGALGGLPTLYVLAFNGLNVGVAGGIITAYGRPAIFWTSILPHGLLEISAILVSGAAGMRLGWSLLAPGDRWRSQALAEEGQRSAVVVLGLLVAFTAAALVEGFVTPRDWPAWIEIGIGALALAAFALPVVVRGRAASAELAARRPVRGGARVIGERSGSAAVWAPRIRGDRAT